MGNEDWAGKPKIQRSYYLTEMQASWLRIQAATRNISQSELLGNLIDSAKAGPQTKAQKSEEPAPTAWAPAEGVGDKLEAEKARQAQRTRQHELLAKIAKGQ